MDVWAVRATAAEVVGRVRAGGGPELVEAVTYRFVGHSRSDPGQVPARGRARPLARSATRCVVAAARLRDEYGLAADEVDAIDRERRGAPRARSSNPRSPPRSRSRPSGAEFAVARG